MAEKLAEIGTVFQCIAEAVKAMSAVRQNNIKLVSITEATKTQAREVENFKLPEEPQQLKNARQALREMKLAMRNVLDSVSKLEQGVKIFFFETSEFETFIKRRVETKKMSEKDTSEICKRLSETHRIASRFSSAFDKFIGELDSGRKAASALSGELKQVVDKFGSSVTDQMTGRGQGVAAGVLSFFTGGMTRILAGIFGSKSATDPKSMLQLSEDLRTGASRLEAVANEMTKICQWAGEVRLDEEALRNLQTALNYFEKENKKETLIAQQQAQMEASDRRIAELEAEFQRRLGEGTNKE